MASAESEEMQISSSSRNETESEGADCHAVCIGFMIYGGVVTFLFVLVGAYRILRIYKKRKLRSELGWAPGNSLPGAVPLCSGDDFHIIHQRMRDARERDHDNQVSSTTTTVTGTIPALHTSRPRPRPTRAHARASSPPVAPANTNTRPDRDLGPPPPYYEVVGEVSHALGPDFSAPPPYASVASSRSNHELTLTVLELELSESYI